jgi:3-oxoacyl-(acyl-carrier-protein) synthase
MDGWGAMVSRSRSSASGGSDGSHPGFGQSDLNQLDPDQPDLGPVQKLAAEMTALALADAGLREAAGNSRTGMIIASSVPGLGDLVSGQLGFGASGPFPPAARTSSLHAVAAATAALQTGQLDLAIAGGAELGLDPVWLTLRARAGTLGTDEMRVYAADPAGLLPGEGCGVVILVRSADARAAGVPVYAEIAGWSAVPAGPADLAGPALEQAYERAGTDPADIQYIEATPGPRRASRAWSGRRWRWPPGPYRPVLAARGRIRSSPRATRGSGCRNGRSPGRTAIRAPRGPGSPR